MVYASSKTAAQKQAERRAAERERLERGAKVRREQEIREARKSAARFVEYALRDEQDGSRLHAAPFHRDWHALLDAHPWVVLVAPIEHGKSQQIGVGKVLHLLGQNPSRRIALISNTATQAEKLLRQIRATIQSNTFVQDVFPNLRRSTRAEDPWHTSQITVARPGISKDPSIQAYGVFGPIVGSRLDVIVLDDVLDFENTRTEEQRKKLIEWFDTTVFSRLVKGGRIYVIGTPWHPDDLLHELASRPGFTSRIYSAVENPNDPPNLWRPIWPEQWDLARLLERRANQPENVFTRKYLCRVRLDETSRFREIWLQRMCALGAGRTFLAEAPKRHVRGAPLPCFTGVDLGVEQKDDSALTVLFTLALMPDGRRLVVEIESGRWQAPEIIDRLASCYRRFQSTILVENNGAQKFLIDMCNGRVPVLPFRTGSNKMSEQYGVESLAVEMRNNLWVMPSGAKGLAVPAEGAAFMRECLYYTPEAHTGDRLMAAWLAREAVRRYAGGNTRQLDTLRR